MKRARISSPVIDASVALAVTALELSYLLFSGDGSRDALTVVLVVVGALALFGWRRWPLATLQVSGWATIGLAAHHGAHLGLAPIAATYAVASWGGRRSRYAGAATLLVGVWLVPLLTADASAIPRNAAMFAGAWIAGALMRDRRLRTAELEARTRELVHEREARAAIAVEAERARIATELHDILTHSVSVMVVQAQGAQAVQDDPERVRAALAVIESVGRATLDDLRALLREGGAVAPTRLAPQPQLDGLEALVGTLRDTGLTVTLQRDGPVRALPQSVELSAYRIVQEALTNALRHGGGTATRVQLRYGDDALELEVCDTAAQVAAAGPPPGDGAESAGRGIAGMRERARAVGGTLTAGRQADGGFAVRARLPLQGPAS